jgi:hypothetical protein
MGIQVSNGEQDLIRTEEDLSQGEQDSVDYAGVQVLGFIF